MSVIGTRPVRPKSSPGTKVWIGEPGLKPSLRLYSSGRIGTPAALRGIPSSGSASRLPVGVEASGRVKKSFGHGCRQTAGSSGSQPACGSD